VATVSTAPIMEFSGPRDRQYLLSKQASKRYSCLFSDVPTGTTSSNRSVRPLSHWKRRGTGIAVRFLRHGQLTSEQLEAIGEYRLEQYILAGMYDGRAASELGLTTDPALHQTFDSTLHLVIGDDEDHLLCYVSFEVAHLPAPYYVQAADSYPVHPWMVDTHRLYFPVEIDYGHELYATHPGLALLPVANVREMTRLVRNQAIRGPAATVATTEVIVATAKMLREHRYRVEAIIGCASPEVRRLLYRLNIPMAYAPLAVDRLGQHPASLDATIWSPDAATPGKFWPIALSSRDVSAGSCYFDALDTALEADPGHILEACQQALVQSRQVTPRYSYALEPDSTDARLQTGDGSRLPHQWVPYFDQSSETSQPGEDASPLHTPGSRAVAAD
jgi:hypothetical protein